MNIIGIDTSCDDTAVGIVTDGYTIRSNVIASQHSFHVKYGGIVPSVASRQHSKIINPLIAIALEEAGLTFEQIDAVAVSSDQGLAPSLAVGVAAAKSLAMVLQKPLIGIHHVEGHIYSNPLVYRENITFPFLCLTVAGGHTMLLLVKALGTYELLGHCRDDSAGEAYDKVARRLGVGYPGGPIIDQLAKNGDPEAFNFPRPLLHSQDLEFSFSGLKSAVNRTVDQLESRGDTIPVNDIAASFQSAVIDVLIAKMLSAVQSTGIRVVTLAGGVAANGLLNERLRLVEESNGLSVFIPPRDLCIDNGAMVAGFAYHAYHAGYRSNNQLDYRANAPLGSLAVKYKPETKYKTTQAYGSE